MKMLAAVLGCLACSAGATELVFTPVNPSFGGSPLNGSWLLGSAQAQNDYKDPSLPSYGSRSSSQSSLDRFNERLQMTILDRLASSVSSNIIDTSGNFHPGEIDTGAFHIVVQDIGNGMVRVTTTDKSTGAISVFEVSNRL
ncbi:curli assembly protein CsgF [Gulbenkiania mobilis]|uniref:curli assembly protein CsgF n=1 Tax=Gulbenkiania mobilis TaxID=397457 RepID=UPI0006BBA458|nr:curli assembly protein CsgF [Gulbenkiania mobilis]